MNFFTVDKLAGYASLQDLGRNNTQHMGFSGSGAADEYSYCLANYLLANPVNTPALEITFGQMSLTANAKCTFILTGADCDACLISANKKTTQTLKNNQPYQLRTGEQIQLNHPKTQLHTYLAIKGGFIGKLWLNSVSQAINEIRLGFTETMITNGSQLTFTAQDSPTNEKKTNSTNRPADYHFHQVGHLVLRYLPSQLWHNLTNNKQQEFINQDYQISAQSNRMGYRLTGKTINLGESDNHLSKPVCFGTIQLPSDGQPIVLMKDRQTIGGYPVLGTVIQTDLFRLSQKRPGESVSFLPITLEQAQAQLFAFSQKFIRAY